MCPDTCARSTTSPTGPTTGPTDIDNLTFACGPHHRLLGHGWTTRKHPNGTTEWIPPPQLTLGEGRQLTPSY
ncbi:REP13E12 repeat protein [Mycobacteroides abscessus subsp. abscessus]|nr:REP13E12 repeat protein [Mycobacteroides abscessus subsp. abscessus]